MNYILRPWNENDTQNLCKYANNKHIADNLKDSFPYPYTEEDAQYFINRARNYPKEKGVIYAIEYNGEAVGNVSVELKSGVYRKTIEIGYWLGEPYWRRGIMTSALTEVVDQAFRNENIVRVYAEVMENNIGGRHVLEKSGLKLEAILHKNIYKNEQVCDSCIYSKIRD